jgi:hypothetical protein
MLPLHQGGSLPEQAAHLQRLEVLALGPRQKFLIAERVLTVPEPIVVVVVTHAERMKGLFRVQHDLHQRNSLCVQAFGRVFTITTGRLEESTMWGCSEGVRVREFKDPAEQQDPFSWAASGNGFPGWHRHVARAEQPLKTVCCPDYRS